MVDWIILNWTIPFYIGGSDFIIITLEDFNNSTQQPKWSRLLWVTYENDVININLIFKSMLITIFSTFSKGQQLSIVPQFMEVFE